MAYAETTKVPIHQTKADIEKLVNKYQSASFAVMTTKNQAQIAFQIQNRNVLFRVDIPENAQKARARWRALLLVIKAKLESVDAGIETFDDAFLANIVLPDGQTVSDALGMAIENQYAGDTTVPLLQHIT